MLLELINRSHVVKCYDMLSHVALILVLLSPLLDHLVALLAGKVITQVNTLGARIHTLMSRTPTPKKNGWSIRV